MTRVARLVRRLSYLLRLRSHDAELAEELASHEAFSRQAFESAGLDHRAAATASRRAMGDVTRMREDARAVWVRPWLESAMQDGTYALRGLRRQPGFSIVAITTLGIAIGLNTSVFTAFNGVFWRPWPVFDPATFFEVTIVREGQDRHSDFSLAEYREMAARGPSQSALVGMACTDGYYPGCDVWLDDAILRPAYVSANAFQVFGVRMEHGRAFTSDDDRTGAPSPVVVLSDEVWRRRFGADPAIVNKQIRLDGVPFAVVGIAPATFAGISVLRTDLWMPLGVLPLLRKRDAASHLNHLQLASRIPPGVSAQKVREELDVLVTGMRADQAIAARTRPGGGPHVRLANTTLNPNPGKLHVAYVGFGLMLLGSLLVILLACANLANLYLARAAARGREIAVRISLGASRGRVIRQLLTESFVLAGSATVLGLATAFVAPTFLLRLLAADALSTRPVPDLTVLAYAAALAVIACLAFGLAPAFHATRSSIGGALKERYGLGGGGRSLRHAFLAIQVAVSVVVLCGAGFLMRGLGHVAQQRFGFDWTGVSTITMDLPASQDSGTTANFARDIMRAVARRPDARLIGATATLPFGERSQTVVLKPGQDSASASWMLRLAVSSEYFSVLGIPLVSGRSFMASDVGGDAILVNQAAADRLWPGQTPVGQTLIVRSPRQVVGVVRNADTEGKAAQEGSVLPKIYQPIGAAGSTMVPKFVARGASAKTLREIADLAHRLAPTARVTTESLSESLDRTLQELRSDALFVAILGGVSLILVSIGIFGVFAYVVQQRTREIGIRMALGAGRPEIIRVVVGSSVRPIIIGLAVGLVAAVGESFVVRGFVYGVSPYDPITYAMIVVILGAAALIAVYFPTRRASRIAPIVALRVD